MISVYKNHREDLFCILLLFALALAVVHPVIVRGEIPVEISSGHADRPWWDGAAPNLSTLEHYGNYAFINTSAQHDDSILWNPYLDTGTPFFAKWRTRCLSPFTLPMYVFPLAIALPLSVVLKILVSGWTAYYASRRLGLAASFALTVACAYELSGHLLGVLIAPISDVLPWIPAIFLFTERIAVGQLRYWPIGAILWALALLGGAPEAVAGTFVFCALYASIRYYTRREFMHASPAAAVFTASLCAGGALAGVQIVPYLDLVRHSVFSEPLWPPWPVRSTLYWGFVPLLLMGLWFSVRRGMATKQRERIDALVGASVLTIALALAFESTGHVIPVLRFIRAEHWMIVNGFAFMLAGVASAETWLDLTPEDSMSVVRRMVLVLPALIIATALGAVLGSAENIAASWVFLNATLVFGFVVLFAVTLLKPRAWILGYGLALIVATEFLMASHGANAFADPEDLLPPTKIASHLLETNSRIGGSEDARPWPLATSGLRQFHGPDPLRLERFDRFAREAAKRPVLLGEAACRFNFITAEDLTSVYAPARPAFRLEEVYPSGMVLAELLTARERASVTYDGRFVDTFDEHLLRADEPPLVEVNIRFQVVARKTATPRILDTQSNVYVPIDVTDTGPGLLVLADAFHPGWIATVDGNTAEVIPVNGAFRGVVLGPEAKRAEFFYISPTLRTGQYVSILAALLVSAGLYRLVMRRVRKRNGRRPSDAF